jgi:hypothetical protein
MTIQPSPDIPIRPAIQPAAEPTALVGTANSAMPNPSVKSTPRSRAALVIRVPPEPLRPDALTGSPQPAQPGQHEDDEGNDTSDRQGDSLRCLDRDQSLGMLAIPDQARQVRAQIAEDRAQQVWVPP